MPPSGTAELVKYPDRGGPRTTYPVNTLPVTVANADIVSQTGRERVKHILIYKRKTRNDLNAHQ